MPKFSNAQMERMIEELKPLLDHKDVVGYAAARNTRILREETKEYMERREELVLKHGTAIQDEQGNPTGRFEISFGTPAFEEFCQEIEPFAAIEHEPDIFKLKYEDVIGKLSGAEMLKFEWMLED